MENNEKKTDFTHIRLYKSTVANIKKTKEYQRETYDEAICRLIKNYEKQKKNGGYMCEL